jgi:hypothetical protein
MERKPTSQKYGYASLEPDHIVSPKSISISAYRSRIESKKPPKSDEIPFKRAKLPSTPSIIEESWASKPAAIFQLYMKLRKEKTARNKLVMLIWFGVTHVRTRNLAMGSDILRFIYRETYPSYKEAIILPLGLC